MRRLEARLQALEGAEKPDQSPGCIVLEYDSDEHLQRTMADAEAAGFRGTIIALPNNARRGAA